MKMKLNIFYLFVFSLLFNSCGNDDATSSLRYQNSKYAKFEVYVGSETKGGVKIDKEIDSAKYFSAVRESFTGATISFEGEKMMVNQLSVSEISPYKFDGDKLYLKYNNNWQYFGYGNSNEVVIQQNYVAYRVGIGAIKRFRALSNPDFKVDDALGYISLKNLSNLKSESDTLIICTYDSYFR